LRTFFQYGKAIDIKAFGPDHSSVDIYRYNLGLVWKPKSKYGKANKYYKLALKSLEKSSLPHEAKIVQKLSIHFKQKNNADLKIYGPTFSHLVG
jgi:hypothetical protein